VASCLDAGFYVSEGSIMQTQAGMLSAEPGWEKVEYDREVKVV